MRDPSNWTREHDRLIAERVEGAVFMPPAHMQFDRGALGRTARIPIPHYRTDLLACHRAAETWRKAGLSRRWEIHSIIAMEAYAETVFTEDGKVLVHMSGAIGEAANRDGVDVVETFARALYELAERSKP